VPRGSGRAGVSWSGSQAGVAPLTNFFLKKARRKTQYSHCGKTKRVHEVDLKGEREREDEVSLFLPPVQPVT